MYEEKEEFHFYGTEPYDLETDFIFDCHVMHFMDDQIRLRFHNDWDNPI